MVIRPPEQFHLDAGAVPLEHDYGELDISAISVFSLVQYMVAQGIPMDARISAGTWHAQPFLSLIWDPK
jgi:hypothetical protein